MILYHALTVLILLAMGFIVLWNLKVLKRPHGGVRSGQEPFLSVLIPARNEERNMEPCLLSLLAQSYPHFEIVVYDDDSQDGTRRIVEEIAHRDPRVRLLAGGEIAEGWLGKCHACHQLAHAARGDLLLFTDADTVHEPGSLSAGVAEMERTGADLFTLITRIEMETFWEKLVLPLVYFTALAYLPFALVRHSANSKFAMANGQFMLFRRPAYEAVGGHEAVRRDVVEDVWLARRIKDKGLNLVIEDGSGLVRCRMYHHLGEIWEGFSKNIFPAFDYSLPLIICFMIFSFIFYILPFALLTAGVFFRLDPLAWMLLPAIQILLAVQMRLALAFRFRLSILSSLLHSLGTLMLLAIAAKSIYWVRSGRGTLWKGRRYHFYDAANSRVNLWAKR